MSDSLVARYTRHEAAGVQELEPEAIEADMGCFGWLRGVKDRALMLELRKQDGHVLAIGYAWLERAEFHPEKGITLFTPGRTVVLQGSGLNHEPRPHVTLFGGLVRHRVPWVREASRAEKMQASPGATTVERILWDE